MSQSTTEAELYTDSSTTGWGASDTAPAVKFVVSSDELREELAVIFRNIHGRDADELLEALVPNKAPFPPQLSW